jgi:large subunit ribosomal protein L24
MDFRKGDNVVVLSGAEKGKTGRVLSVDRKKMTLIIERVRLIKRHTKPGRQAAMQGGIIEKEAPIAACKVALLDPRSNKPTRLRTRILMDGSKVRVAAKSGEVIEKV